MTRPEGVKLEYCPNPKCRQRSLFWNQTKQIWECLNTECRRIYTSSEFSEYWHNKQSVQPAPRQTTRRRKAQQITFDAPLWLVNILESRRFWGVLICLAIGWWCWTGISLVLAIALAFPILLLYIIKLLLRKYLNNYNALAMQHTISPLFYTIRKSSLLRLGVILITIALLTTTIWSIIWSIYSFIPDLIQNASLIYLLPMAVLIAAQIWLLNWLCKTLRHSRYISRKPRFAVVFWSVFAIIVFCAFVGIQPFSDIKTNVITSITDAIASIAKPPAEPPAQNLPPPPANPDPSSTTIYETNKGKYPNRVWMNDYTYASSDSGRAIELHENPNAKNPTWEQLLSFLRADNTDKMAYVPGNFVCADFAEMLHNNAERAGIRCGFAVLYGIRHACNAFETTDRGLIFIDCTGQMYQTGPYDKDTIVDVRLGIDYIPRFLFSNRLGNITWTVTDMGTVTRYQICWIAGEIMDYQYDYDAVAYVPPYVPPYILPPSSTPIFPSYVPPYVPPPTPSVPVSVCRSCCEDRCSKYQGTWRNGCIDDCMKGETEKWSWK